MGSIHRESVLFLTNSEHGQSNIQFATAYEFLMRDEFDVHIASYPSLAQRVQDLNEIVQLDRQKAHGKNSSKSKAIFHTLSGVSMVDNVNANNLIWPHKTGVSNVVQGYRDMSRIVIRDDHNNYLTTYDNILEIIKSLVPTVVVVDSAFFPALDACRIANIEFVVLCPLTFYELVGGEQPQGQIFWKFPATGSGHPYPIPWNLVLANIWLLIQMILKYVFSPSAKSLTAARKAHGIDFPLALAPLAGKVHICPSLREIDYPMSFVPDWVLGVGPIILPISPVSQSDPDLAFWLSRPHSKTILVNLGSNFINTPSSALEMASAFCTLLHEDASLQILWKLKTRNQSTEFQALTSPFIKQDRLRISSWIIPETTSVLTHPNVIAFVHHGGANSFFESCHAGLPQVVLPPWYDCYQNAAKVEYLGTGVFASKKTSPEVERCEFLVALKRVVTDEKMRERAREVGVLCRKTVGRERACEKIIEVARGVKITKLD